MLFFLEKPKSKSNETSGIVCFQVNLIMHYNFLSSYINELVSNQFTIFKWIICGFDSFTKCRSDIWIFQKTRVDFNCFFFKLFLASLWMNNCIFVLWLFVFYVLLWWWSKFMINRVTFFVSSSVVSHCRIQMLIN